MSHYQNNRDNNRHYPYPPNDRRGSGSRGYSYHGGRGRGGRGYHYSNDGGWRNERGGYEYNQREPPQNGTQGQMGTSHPDTPPNVDRNRNNQGGSASDSLPNAVTDFLSMRYVEQLEAQIPSSETDKISFKQKLPTEAIEPYSKDGVRRHSDEWKAHKEKIAAKVMEGMKQSLAQMANNAYDDIDSDDSDTMIGLGLGGGGCQLANQIKSLEAFILALTTCHLMTVGFDYSGSVAEETCFCPCHRLMSNWRTLASVSIGEGECKGNGRFKKPNHLIAHLKSMKNCRFHEYALKYLEELYDNWYPNHLKHKGLYIETTDEYNKAVKEEKRLHEQELQRMRKLVAEMLKREEREKKIEDGMETLRNTNVDLAEKLKVRGEMLKLLGVDPVQTARSPPEEAMLPVYEKMYHEDFWWEGIHRRFRVVRSKPDKSAKSSESRIIRVKQDFSLQDFFDKLSSVQAENEFASILFKDLRTDRDVNLLLSRWRIEFEVPDVAKSVSKKEKKNIEPEDAGGPEAQFFSYVFQRIPGLKVCVPGSAKSIELFDIDNIPSGYLPTSDEQFRSRFQGKDYQHVKQKAEKYYRAIGRLFAHCLSVGHKLPTEALPQLLRNAVIRGCMPTHPDYLDLDLADHLVLIGINGKRLDWYIQAAESKPDKFKKQVQEDYITKRDIWMQSFRKGLFVEISGSGEKCVALPNLLRLVPLDVVDSLMFASNDFKADDIVKILVPHYSNDSNLQQSQRELFETALPQILKTWEMTNRGMLSKFLSFTTGFSYLPIVPDFEISIMFETRAVPGSSSSENRLPESHTCERTLSIPRMAYNGDFKVFEHKLTMVVESDYDKFTQN